MADDPNNPFARASAWPRMPSAPMRVGPLPKAEPTPEPVRTITPVFTRPVAPSPAPRADAPPPAEAAVEPPGTVVTPLPIRPRPKSAWKPFAIAAGFGAVVVAGSAVLLSGRPEPAEPRLAAAVTETPPPAQVPAATPTAAKEPPVRPIRIAAAPRRAAVPAPAPDPLPTPPSVELNAPLQIPPVPEPTPAPPPPLAAQPPPVDPDAPVATKPPY